MKRSLISLFIFLVLLQGVCALSSSVDVDQVVVNSNNWEDIFQGLLFAKLVNVPGDFIFEPDRAFDVARSIPQDKTRVLLVESSGREQYRRFDSLLEQEGFEVVELDGSGPAGPRLANILSYDSLIITDSRYPYNAISLAPYALLKESFVLFSEDDDVDELSSLAQEKDVTIYGLVDARVKEAFPDATIIDQGGKFDNNIFVVKEFLKTRQEAQVVMTNGEFLEYGLVDDAYPTLFVGSTHVPDQVETFFAEENMSYGVLVGNHLSGLVTNFKYLMKDKYDKDVFFFVRFGKSPRVLEEQFMEPHALEYFPLPLNIPELELISIVFNRLSASLEVTFSNPSSIPVFFSSSFSLIVDGESVSVGDEETQVIVAGQEKTLVYDVGSDARDVSGSGLVLFGDYPSSLEYEIPVDSGGIDVIEIIDGSELELVSITYDKFNKAFFIEVSNPGSVVSYGNIELIDVIIDGLPTTIGTKKTFRLEPGETDKVFVRADLSDLDIFENEDVLVRGVYGQREKVLFKEIEKSLDLKVTQGPLYYIIAGVVIVVALLLALLFLRRKLFICDKCGEKRKARLNPGRHLCGGRFQRP